MRNVAAVAFAILCVSHDPSSARAETHASTNNVVRLNGTEYFVRATAAYGGELWRSDGTDGGTFMVKDISAGPASSLSPASHLATLGGVLFFFANDGASGTELWRSDGTSDGTVLVKDIRPGPAGSVTLASITVLETRLLFFADDGQNGRELWTSDGSVTGTTLVKDIHVGPRSSVVAASDMDIRALGNRAFFRADNGTTGSQLWLTDGTEAGTTMVTVCADHNALGGRWADASTGPVRQHRSFQFQRISTPRSATR
jgi:ELWxxDGT repeat protein